MCGLAGTGFTHRLQGSTWCVCVCVYVYACVFGWCILVGVGLPYVQVCVCVCVCVIWLVWGLTRQFILWCDDGLLLRQGRVGPSEGMLADARVVVVDRLWDGREADRVVRVPWRRC